MICTNTHLMARNVDAEEADMWYDSLYW